MFYAQTNCMYGRYLYIYICFMFTCALQKIRLGGNRVADKHRKKLADLEAQLVLASPNLVFRVGSKSTQRAQTFILSSDFERTQWIESIHSLQVS